jgi:hypothetical protein
MGARTNLRSPVHQPRCGLPPLPRRSVRRRGSKNEKSLERLSLGEIQATNKGYDWLPELSADHQHTLLWNGNGTLKSLTNLYRDFYLAAVFKAARLTGNPHPR